MNIHKNARLTFARRLEMVKDISDAGCHAVQRPRRGTASALRRREVAGPLLGRGETGLLDRSSRPARSPALDRPARPWRSWSCAVNGSPRRASRPAWGSPRVPSGRVLARAGLSRLRDLEPLRPVVRYEHARPGRHDPHRHQEARAHRAHEPPHHRRSTRLRRGAGWEFLFVAIDDHARIGFTDMYPDERNTSAVQFLTNTVAYFRSLGVRVKARAHRQRLGVPLQGLRQGLPTPAASSTASPDPIDLRPTARPSASSSRPCASGPMASPTTTPRSAPTCSIAGPITTTGIARIRVSVASRPSAASLSPETTS